MKKVISAFVLFSILLSTVAFAEFHIPEYYVLTETAGKDQDTVRRFVWNETNLTVVEKDGVFVSACTDVFPASAHLEQSVEKAIAMVPALFDGARVIGASGPKALPDGGFSPFVCHVLSDEIAGSVWIIDDSFAGLDLTGGVYRREGLLTPEGVEQFLACYRPDAKITELEKETEHGITVWEGECLLGDDEYEFEIHAETGVLLEWERD